MIVEHLYWPPSLYRRQESGQVQEKVHHRHEQFVHALAEALASSCRQ
jgi:hypothetical protein